MDTTEIRKLLAEAHHCLQMAADGPARTALLRTAEKVADLLDCLPEPAEHAQQHEDIDLRLAILSDHIIPPDCKPSPRHEANEEMDRLNADPYLDPELKEKALLRERAILSKPGPQHQPEEQAEPEEDDESMEDAQARQRYIQRLRATLIQKVKQTERLQDDLLKVEHQRDTAQALKEGLERDFDAALAEARALRERLEKAEKERDIFRQQAAEANDERVYANGERDKAEAALAEARQKALEEAALGLEEAAQKGEAGGGWRRGICDSAEWVRALADEPEQAEKDAAREGKEE